jgi:hypothetical protein
LIDDGAQGKRPWIVFNFMFQNTAYKTIPRQNSGARIRASPSEISPWADEDIPSRPLSVSPSICMSSMSD